MYAQVLKSNNIVNLIGGAEVGLPIHHPDVWCIDIGNNSEDIKEGYYYSEELGFLSESPITIEPIPEPTEEEIVQAELLLNQLLMQEQLNSIDMVNAQILLNSMGGM